MRESRLTSLSIVAFTGAFVLLGSAIVLYLGAFDSGWTVSALFDGIMGGVAIAFSAYMVRLGFDLRAPRKRANLAGRLPAQYADETRKAA